MCSNANSKDRLTVRVPTQLEDLIPFFLDEVTELIGRVKADPESFGDVRRYGHTIKGVGRTYGFGGVSEYGLELEQAALREDAAAVRTAVAQLADYLDRVDIVFGD